MAASKCRDEIVGRRFLSVRSASKLKFSKISEWDWRAGVIRAATHKDTTNTELAVLVEFDDSDWKRREWIRIYDIFQVFLVERTLHWALKSEPNGRRRQHWPALTFRPLVDKVGLTHSRIKPLEYFLERQLEFPDDPDLQTYLEDDPTVESPAKANEDLLTSIRRWQEQRDGQSILLTTPSVLVGYRVEVYRAEGTTQWYTAVIQSYNDSTQELSVTDDTVLEEHNEDPSLVQMKLIGDGVVESILKGENIGITPRRRSCTTRSCQANNPSGSGNDTPLSRYNPPKQLRSGSPITAPTVNARSSARSKARQRGSDTTANSTAEKDKVSDKISGKSKSQVLRKRKSGDLAAAEEPAKKPGPAASRRAKVTEVPSERTSSPRSLRSSPITTEKSSRSSPLLPPHTQPQVLVKPVKALPETRIIRDFKDKVRERDKTKDTAIVLHKPKRLRAEPDSRPSRDTTANSQPLREESDKGEDKCKKDKSDKDTSDKRSAISPRSRRTDESRVTRVSVQRLRRDENQRKTSPDPVSQDSNADKHINLATSPAEGLRSHTSKSSKAIEPSRSSLHSTSSGGSIVSQHTAVTSGENSGNKAAATPASPSQDLGSSTTQNPLPTLATHKHWQTLQPKKVRQSSPSPKPQPSSASPKPLASSAPSTQHTTSSILSCPKPQETDLSTISQDTVTIPPKQSHVRPPSKTRLGTDSGEVSQTDLSVKADPDRAKASNVSKPVESPSSKDGRPSSAGCEVKPEPTASQVKPESADSEAKQSYSQVKPAAVNPADKEGEHPSPKPGLCRSSEGSRGRSLVRTSSSNSLLSSARSKDGEDSSKMHFKKMHLLGDGFHTKKEDGDKDSFSSDSSGINVNHSLTDQLAKRAKPPESLGWNNNHVGASPAPGMEPGHSYPGQNGSGEGPFSPREADRLQKSRDYEPARPASASQSVHPRMEETQGRPLSAERRHAGPSPSFSRGEELRPMRLEERHAIFYGRVDELKRMKEGGPASSSPLVFDKNEPVRVYRDPELLKQDEIRMQHHIPARPSHPSPAPRTSPSYSGVHSHPSPHSAHHALAAQHAANPMLSPLQYRQGVSPLSPHMALPSAAIDSRMALNAQQQAHLLTYGGSHLMAAAYSGTLHPSLQTAQLELLWQHKYPTLPVPPAWMLAQYQDELLRDVNVIALERDRRERELALERDRAERDRAEREKAERDRQERQRKEQADRERLEQEKIERERAEREKLERQRKEEERAKREFQERQERDRILRESAEAAAAVNQHFTESLRLASQKMTPHWTRGAPTPYNKLRDVDALPLHPTEPAGWLSEEQAAAGVWGGSVPLGVPAKPPALNVPSDPRVPGHPSAFAPLHSHPLQGHPRDLEIKLEHKEGHKMSEPHGRPSPSPDHRGDERHIEHSRDSKVDIKPPPHSLYGSYTRPNSAHNAPTSSVPGVKQEANFSLYGYQPFQHTYISQDKLYLQGLTESRGVKEEMPGSMTSPAQHSKSHMATPPPLLKDHKSSVIVENKPHEVGGMPHPPPAHHAPRAPNMPLGLMARPHQGSITLGTAVSPRPNPKGMDVRPPPAHSQAPTRLPLEPKMAHRSPHSMAVGYHAVGQPLVSMPGSSSGLPYGLLQPGVMPAYTQGAASHVAKMAMDVQARGLQGAAPARSSPPQAGSVPAPGSSGLPSPLAGQKRRSPTLSPAGAAAAAAAAAAKRPKTEDYFRQAGPGASQQHPYRVGSPHVGAPATQVPNTTPNGVTRTTSSGFLDSFRSFVENTVQTAFFQDSQLSKQPPRSRHKATGSPLPPSLPPATTTATPATSTSSPAPRPAPATSATPPLAPHPALPQNPITMASIQRPAPSNTPGSVSSTSSIQETMNRVANGFLDTDSDTLSAPSPPPHLRADATSSPKAHNHTKFKKAWLLRYSDEDKDKAKSDSPSSVNRETENTQSSVKSEPNTSNAGDHESTPSTDSKMDTQTDVKEEKDSKDAVKDCYVNCSYITGPQDRSRSPASVKDSVSDMGKSPEPKEKDAKESDKDSKKDKAESMSSSSDTESQESESSTKRRIKPKRNNGTNTKKSRTEEPLAPTKKRFTRKAKEKEKKPLREDEVVQETKEKEERTRLVQKVREREAKDIVRPTSDAETKMERKRRCRAREAKEKSSKKEKDETKDESGEEDEDEEEEMEERKKEDRRNKKDAGKKSNSAGPSAGTLATKPLNKVSMSKLRKTMSPFLQDDSCSEVTPKLMKCRECKMTPNQRNKKMPNIFCRFYAFRRLRYNQKQALTIAGFSEPTDAEADDIELWMPSMPTMEPKIDLLMAKYLLTNVGDRFCELVEQEKEAMSWVSPDTQVAWKRAVQGVREMCDVCNTTLFNMHWVCHRCGFVVCIDCYRLRTRKGVSCQDHKCTTCEQEGATWLKCSVNRQPHEPDKLMLTQIIPSDALWVVGRMIHEVREKWRIGSNCPCGRSKAESMLAPKNGLMNQFTQHCLNEEKKVNGDAKVAVNGSQSRGMSPLSLLADVASLDSENPIDSAKMKEALREKLGELDDDDEAKDVANCSTLRELLTKTAGRKAANKEASGKKGKMVHSTLDDIIQQVVERNVAREERSIPQLKHYIPRVGSSMQGRDSPIPTYTLTETSVLFPDVPHSWLDGGRLLRLHDPHHKGNLELFQQQWRRAQPILVSNSHKHLSSSLWTPKSFTEEFGHIENDLVNCRTGVVLVGHCMREFWEGFESMSLRLCDEDGDPMILKLKDWPPTEDFSDMQPKRFTNLMNALPLPEYTHRNGVFNLASRLPDFFVRPDLGPKMYNAYGSALHPKEGTTNLHLDMSDAVNVMVYVGVPSDDTYNHREAALDAIEEANACMLTRQRVREQGEKPGALWHIFDPCDADKIRDLLNKAGKERGEKIEPHHDPIHDQAWYLDNALLKRLQEEYGVQGYTIVQCMGDAVFIPAGAPHQVRNLHSCIKVAEDFVSPENLNFCFKLTQEFRHLSETHSNHEDKLQVKNIIYHAVKDAVAVLMDTDP